MALSLAHGDVDTAGLSPADLELVRYAEKLTSGASGVSDADIEALRAHGFTDAQVWEATFVAAFFNLVTRMADAFGISPRPEWEAALGLEPPGASDPSG